MREVPQQREIGFEEISMILTEVFRSDFKRVRIKIDNAKRAAVMCILYPKRRQPYMLLTRRKETLFDHGGEISFPGGSEEDHDNDLLGTALREVEEELGLTLTNNDVMGELSEVFTYSSNFVISPFLAILDTPPQVKSPSAEVSYILEVDFNQLLGHSKYREDELYFGERSYSLPYYDYAGEVIWGATAEIINQIVNIIGDRALRL